MLPLNLFLICSDNMKDHRDTILWRYALPFLCLLLGAAWLLSSRGSSILLLAAGTYQPTAQHSGAATLVRDITCAGERSVLLDDGDLDPDCGTSRDAQYRSCLHSQAARLRGSVSPCADRVRVRRELDAWRNSTGANVTGVESIGFGGGWGLPTWLASVQVGGSHPDADVAMLIAAVCLPASRSAFAPLLGHPYFASRLPLTLWMQPWSSLVGSGIASYCFRTCCAIWQVVPWTRCG